MAEQVLDILERLEVGIGGEIQLTDALDELLQSEKLNALETDAAIFDCGNKKGFLGANLAVGMRDTSVREYLKSIFDKY